ncbi:MAG: DUF2283 domain-containing protein [Nitrospirota bacterium]|nr:DUF2283 domain-containing protein [Nitrospirota bacterium]
MKIIYDPDTDTLSLIFREEDIAESDEIREGVIIDYSKDGKIVSMEILDASEQISDAGKSLFPNLRKICEICGQMQSLLLSF